MLVNVQKTVPPVTINDVSPVYYLLREMESLKGVRGAFFAIMAWNLC